MSATQHTEGLPSQYAEKSAAELASIARGVGQGAALHARHVAIRELELRATQLEVPAEWQDYAKQYGAAEAIERARSAGGFGIAAVTSCLGHAGHEDRS